MSDPSTDIDPDFDPNDLSQFARPGIGVADTMEGTRFAEYLREDGAYDGNESPPICPVTHLPIDVDANSVDANSVGNDKGVRLYNKDVMGVVMDELYFLKQIEMRNKGDLRDGLKWSDVNQDDIFAAVDTWTSWTPRALAEETGVFKLSTRKNAIRMLASRFCRMCAFHAMLRIGGAQADLYNTVMKRVSQMKHDTKTELEKRVYRTRDNAMNFVIEFTADTNPVLAAISNEFMYRRNLLSPVPEVVSFSAYNVAAPLAASYAANQVTYSVVPRALSKAMDWIASKGVLLSPAQAESIRQYSADFMKTYGYTGVWNYVVIDLLVRNIANTLSTSACKKVLRLNDADIKTEPRSLWACRKFLALGFVTVFLTTVMSAPGGFTTVAAAYAARSALIKASNAVWSRTYNALRSTRARDAARYAWSSVVGAAKAAKRATIGGGEVSE